MYTKLTCLTANPREVSPADYLMTPLHTDEEADTKDGKRRRRNERAESDGRGETEEEEAEEATHVSNDRFGKGKFDHLYFPGWREAKEKILMKAFVLRG